MGLSEEEKKAIVKYRLEKAKETLLDLNAAIESKRWNNAANRMYYACFYAAMALLINDGHEARTHNGVKALLGLHYVTNELISAELNIAYRQMFTLRQTGDYDDLAVISENNILPLLAPAEKFIETIENLINTNS